MRADKKRVRVYTALLVNTCLRGGALVSQQLVSQGPGKQASLEMQVAVGGSCRGWFESEIFRETYSFVWLW